MLFFDGESCDNLITALAVLMPGGCNSRKISYHFGLRRAQQLYVPMVTLSTGGHLLFPREFFKAIVMKNAGLFSDPWAVKKNKGGQDTLVMEGRTAIGV